MNIIDATAQSFPELLDQHEIIVCDFWASWCAPCKSFHTVMTQAATQYSSLCFTRIDIETAPELTREFNISSVPHILIMKSRTVVYDHAGALNLAEFTELLDKVVALDLNKGGI